MNCSMLSSATDCPDRFKDLHRGVSQHAESKFAFFLQGTRRRWYCMYFEKQNTKSAQLSLAMKSGRDRSLCLLLCCLKSWAFSESISQTETDFYVYWFVSGALSAHFNTVEDNMAKRRKHIMSLLESSEETILSITVFPRIGCPPFTDPEVMPQPESSVSM